MSIDLLYYKLDKYYKKINLKNYNYKFNKIKNINLLQTKFIPDKIREYIKKKINYKYTVLYEFKNILITLNYYSPKKIKKSILDNILKRIIFMMLISNKYMNININIYSTPFKKEFNCNSSHKCGNLKHINVNSGLNYDDTIIIFRDEEYLKLLLHELIHALDVDQKYENLDDNKDIFEIFNINTKNLLINESYVETWAIILNVYITLKEENNVSLEKFKLNLNKELVHSLHQCSKLCIFYDINDFNKIYKINRDTVYYKDNVNTFSYHIIKTLNLYNIKKFLKNFCDKNYILKSKYNYRTYIKFIVKYNKTMANKINVIIKKINIHNLGSLRMSSI